MYRIIIKVLIKTNTFNIGSGVSSTLKQVLEILRDVTKIDFQIKIATKRPIDRMAIELDVSLAKLDLNWNPEFSLYRGIQKTWNSVQSK